MSLLGIDIRSFRYTDDSPVVLSSIEMEVGEGELIGIMGENGCGKTSLLYLCAAELPLSDGLRRTELREREIAIVYQDYRQTLFPWKTAWSNMALPMAMNGGQRHDAPAQIQAVLDWFRIGFSLRKLPAHLSGGEQQKVCVMRALLELPRLLLMDEPFSAMDYGSRLLFVTNLRRLLKTRGTGCIMTSHSAEEAFLFCDRLYVLSKNGGIAFTVDNCQSQANYIHNLDRVHAHFLD